MQTKTRFAPSPTGHLHLGNVRTALFNALLAWRDGGTFLLRIEDTDRERGRDEYDDALRRDLRWLGLDWQEGPEVDGGHGPYHQSQRGDVYAERYRQLEEGGHVYPCFCTAQELEMSRKAQRSAGQAPRYSGKCASLSADEARARMEAGESYTLRFRVPRGRTVEFDDLVRGPQRFASDDIGDFIVRRADGSAAFFFCNAVDDALMGVTHVLRGEDHITNTPRQCLILEALGLSAPRYGHIAMIVGADGAPLSKRHGARSLGELREAGYLPQALVNHLARLGHKYDEDVPYSMGELAERFSEERLGRAPARYDDQQLLFWQRRTLETLDTESLWAWMGEAVHALVPGTSQDAFVQAVRPNATFPEDALHWARVLFTDTMEPGEKAQDVIAEAGADFYREAEAALGEHPDDFKAFADAVKARTGAKGKGLFLPLRAALTGDTGGPEMGEVLPLLGAERARKRLTDCAGA